MNKEDIIKIIEANPEMQYTDLKANAMYTGITAEVFDDAWDEHLRKIRKPPETQIVTQIYIIILMVFTLLGFETAYWKFVIRVHNEMFASGFGILSLFTCFILVVHLASKFAGSKTTIGYTTRLSIFLFILAYLAHLSSMTVATVTYIIILFGGVLAGFIALYATMKTYKIDFLRFLILLLITTLIMSVIIQLTMGLKVFKGFFTPAQSMEIEELESAVDIANE